VGKWGSSTKGFFGRLSKRAEGGEVSGSKVKIQNFVVFEAGKATIRVRDIRWKTSHVKTRGLGAQRPGADPPGGKKNGKDIPRYSNHKKKGNVKSQQKKQKKLKKKTERGRI